MCVVFFPFSSLLAVVTGRNNCRSKTLDGKKKKKKKNGRRSRMSGRLIRKTPREILGTVSTLLTVQPQGDQPKCVEGANMLFQLRNLKVDKRVSNSGKSASRTTWKKNNKNFCYVRLVKKKKINLQIDGQGNLGKKYFFKSLIKPNWFLSADDYKVNDLVVVVFFLGDFFFSQLYQLPAIFTTKTKKNVSSDLDQRAAHNPVSLVSLTRNRRYLTNDFT